MGGDRPIAPPLDLPLDVLPEIDFIYSIKESEKKKTQNVSPVMENSPKMFENKFGLSASAVLCGFTLTILR